MFSMYNDFATIVILLVLALSLIIGRDISRKSLKGIDGIFAALGFAFGLFMTLLNQVYTSKDLFLLSPVIAVSCILYLRYRCVIKERPHDSLLQISNQHNTMLSFIWWFLIGAAVITYYFSEIYTRNHLFFLLISGAVAVLGIQIITYHRSNNTKNWIFILKILLCSIILRYSAYFVSSYPIGSDPWVHQEYIKYFLNFGRIAVPPDFLYYYVDYPISHLYVVCSVLITSISLHTAMFLLGVILTISTIFTFLIVRMLTENVQLALISMLLLNFTDVQIMWSVQVIAMSFGIAIYAFVIYFAMIKYSNHQHKLKFAPFLLVLLAIIVWTHTISAFIVLVSLFALVFGTILYEIIYNRNISIILSQNTLILINPLLFLIIIIFYHWGDPSSLFLDTILERLLNSLSKEAEFLGGTIVSNVTGQWDELLQSLGFCLFVLPGIIGSLYCLSNKYQAKKYFPIMFIVLVLFFIRYIFPIMGLRNIIPDRWPAFAFICFMPFIGFGIFCCCSLLKTKKAILSAVAIFFFVGSLFMATNVLANQDSPLFWEDSSPKFIWSESEMSMYAHINKVCDGKIIADLQTRGRPLKTYLNNKRSEPYQVLQNGTIDKKHLSSGLVIWRKDSLTLPVHARYQQQVSRVLLGDQFREYLNNNYCCISDIYSARSYLSL